MGTVHDLLEANGKQQTLLRGLDRREIEAASAYMADEDSGIGFLYSGWCQAALPHRRLPDEQGWQITGERVTLIVEPGMRAGAAGKPVHVGVPYGSRARLILLYLQSEALRTGSREVELGRSLRGWLVRLGIPIGGKSVEAVREQAERISRCKLTFEVKAGVSKGLVNQTIVDTALFLDLDDETQGSLFVERARLSEGFFEQLKKHPVPLEEAAIKALNNNSMALDIYAWLAYRLHALKSPTPVSWRALRPQFGMGFGRMDNFRARYLDNLKLALAVYPAAKVDVDETGLVLHPSRPPVSPKVRPAVR
jgi:Plasmid encoded RepA protein